MSGAFQSSAFQNSAFQTDGGAVVRYPGPAGGKRKHYVFPDGSRRILTREQLEDALETVLVTTAPPEKAQKVAVKDRQIVATFPSYPDIRDMLIAAKEIEAAQVLRAVAQRLADEDDERDIEVILLWG